MGDGSGGNSGGGRGPQHDTSMVWLICPMASVLSEWVQARGRAPSTELALVREAVRERARRVMLADGTARAQRERAWVLGSLRGPEGNRADITSRKQSRWWGRRSRSPVQMAPGTSSRHAVLQQEKLQADDRTGGRMGSPGAGCTPGTAGKAPGRVATGKEARGSPERPLCSREGVSGDGSSPGCPGWLREVRPSSRQGGTAPVQLEEGTVGMLLRPCLHGDTSLNASSQLSASAQGVRQSVGTAHHLEQSRARQKMAGKGQICTQTAPKGARAALGTPASRSVLPQGAQGQEGTMQWWARAEQH